MEGLETEEREDFTALMRGLSAVGRMDGGVREKGIEVERPSQARDDGGLAQGVCRGKTGLWWNSGMHYKGGANRIC